MSDRTDFSLNFAPQQPDNLHENCVHYTPRTGTSRPYLYPFNDVDCDRRDWAFPLCESLTVNCCPKETCRDDYEEHNGKCYKLHSRKQSYDAALRTCISEGANLIEPRSQADLNLLNSVWGGLGTLYVQLYNRVFFNTMYDWALYEWKRTWCHYHIYTFLLLCEVWRQWYVAFYRIWIGVRDVRKFLDLRRTYVFAQTMKCWAFKVCSRNHFEKFLSDSYTRLMRQRLPWTLLPDNQILSDSVSITLHGQEQARAHVSILSMISTVTGVIGQSLSVKHSHHKDARMATRNIMACATGFIHRECCLKMLYWPVPKRGPPW